MIAVLSPLVPEPYADVLRVLFDEAPQSSIADVHRTLEEELGRPVNEIFTDFDTDPIGVASLAQVHVATLRHSGEKVRNHRGSDSHTISKLCLGVPDFPSCKRPLALRKREV